MEPAILTTQTLSTIGAIVLIVLFGFMLKVLKLVDKEEPLR